MSKIESRHEWVPVTKLKVHPNIQREFSEARADNYARNLNPDALGEIHVQEDGRGSLWIIDGQHRTAAVRIALGEDQQIFCRVFHTDDAQSVAKISLDLNSARRWTPIDTFKVRVVARDWKALAIHGVLHQHGLKVSNNRDKATVKAVAACQWVLDTRGGQAAFERTIKILCQAWGKDPDAYHGSLIKGVGLLVGRYNGEMDDTHLIEKLQKSGGPGRMIGRVRDTAKAMGHSVARAAAEVFLIEYNKGKRGKGLPSWGES